MNKVDVKEIDKKWQNFWLKNKDSPKITNKKKNKVIKSIISNIV